MSSNPGAGYWMDIFSHLFVVRIVTFEQTKINEKEAGVGPFKKKFVYETEAPVVKGNEIKKIIAHFSIFSLFLWSNRFL